MKGGAIPALQYSVLAMWQNTQTTVLFEKLWGGHVRLYAPLSLIFSALHFTYSDQTYAKSAQIPVLQHPLRMLLGE